MVHLLLILVLLLLPIQDGCNATQLGLKNIGRWAGPVPNANSPNKVTWKLTLYSCEAHPNMLAAYLIIDRSYTLRSNVAARPVALPGKKDGEWMEFLFPKSGADKVTIKARRLPDNNLEIIEETSGKRENFSLPPSDQGHDLVLYGENCEQWRSSLKAGRWSERLW